jgi:flagellin
LSAKDDAAGTVIAARMAVQMNGNKIAQNNVQNGNAMLQTAEGHLDVIQDNLSRIRDLTLQAKNGTYSLEEKEAMQDEVEALMDEIDRVNKSSKYSSLALFDDTTLQAEGVTFQVGANSTEENTINASSELFQAVNFSGITQLEKADFNISTYTTTELAEAIDKLDQGLDDITGRKSIIGAVQNRLESALDTLTTQYENLSSAKSVILDANIAQEASDYTQNSILQQVSTSLLAQANQAPSIALSLV